MNNPGYFSMTARERSDAEALILFLREKLLADDPTITGFNIGINCGASAAQTIFHAHIHLIPRRDGDTDDPRGAGRDSGTAEILIYRGILASDAGMKNPHLSTC